MTTVDDIIRDVDAELSVTYDRALELGWPTDQLQVVIDQRQQRWKLEATDGLSPYCVLAIVWLSKDDDGMALNVRRLEVIPPPIASRRPPPKPGHLTAEEISAKCKAIVERGTKPTLIEVRPLIESFYELPGNGAGGALHCVLDDGNWERCHIQSTIDDNRDPVATALARVLLMLSNSQRRRM